MVAFVLAHLFIMHYLHAPSSTGTTFVAGRWAEAGWRLFDGLLLLLALTHGAAGAHAVLRERLRRPRARTTLDAAFVSGTAAFAAVGTLALVSGPGASPGPGPLSGLTWIPAVFVTGLLVVATGTYLALLGVAASLLARVLGRAPLGWWGYGGQWAFALSRIAGLGILSFLLVHILDVALVPWAPDLYQRTVAGYALPYLVPMEVLLVSAVVYHALNGLRLIVLEAFDRRALGAHVPSFVMVIVVTAVLVLPSVVVLLRGHL
jgi:succinate dehydrogenase / fumarate reductase cytochrome b subunit